MACLHLQREKIYVVEEEDVGELWDEGGDEDEDVSLAQGRSRISTFVVLVVLRSNTLPPLRCLA